MLYGMSSITEGLPSTAEAIALLGDAPMLRREASPVGAVREPPLPQRHIEIILSPPLSCVRLWCRHPACSVQPGRPHHNTVLRATPGLWLATTVSYKLPPDH